MYGNDTAHRCKSITCFEDAQKLFLKPKPRGKKRSENERPLNGNDKHHYRVKKADDDAYDVILYQTTLARYHRPAPDGRRRIEYAGYDSALTKNFMIQVLRVNWGVNRGVDTELNPVWWPLTNATLPDGWSAIITKLNDRIVTAESQILCMGTRVMSEKTKQLRKTCHEPWQSIIDMACMRDTPPVFPHTGTYDVARMLVQGPTEDNVSSVMYLLHLHAVSGNTFAEKQALCRKWVRDMLHNTQDKIITYPMWSKPLIQNPIFGLPAAPLVK